MGWKTVKDHYKIQHIVHIRDGRLMIGSSMCTDLIQFDAVTGEFKKHALGSSFEQKHETFPWSSEIMADSKSGKLANLIASVDRFAETVPVFTHDYERIIEKRVEPPIDWPNCCTDGELIYENTHWATRAEAAHDLLITSLGHMAADVGAIDELIERLVERRRYTVRSFRGACAALGLNDKFSFQLQQIELMGRRLVK